MRNEPYRRIARRAHARRPPVFWRSRRTGAPAATPRRLGQQRRQPLQHRQQKARSLPRGERVIEQRLDEGFSYFWLLKFGEFRKYEIPIRNRYVKRRCCFIQKNFLRSKSDLLALGKSTGD